MMTESELTALVERAQQGEKTALEGVLVAIRDDLYRLCLRMMGPLDAQDLTQEVLIKVMTHLSEWKGESSFRTWTWRIATNHVLNLQRGKMENFSLEMMLEQNEKSLAMDTSTLPDVPDEALFAEEIRLACTQAGMMALDRELRIAFILSYVMELPSELCAQVVGIEPAAFRKRLQRARERLDQFVQARCSLVNPAAPCRCHKQIKSTIAAGVMSQEQLLYTSQRCHPPTRTFDWALREVNDMEARFRAVARSHPEYLAPEPLIAALKGIFESDRYRFLKKN